MRQERLSNFEVEPRNPTKFVWSHFENFDLVDQNLSKFGDFGVDLGKLRRPACMISPNLANHFFVEIQICRKIQNFDQKSKFRHGGLS